MYPNTVLDLITKSPTAFHAVSQMKAELDKNGYVEIKENEKFDIKVRKFYVARNNSSIIAINLGESFDAFNIVASHTDSPTFKLKPNFEIISKQCTKLNTEEYGGFLD